MFHIFHNILNRNLRIPRLFQFSRPQACWIFFSNTCLNRLFLFIPSNFITARIVCRIFPHWKTEMYITSPSIHKIWLYDTSVAYYNRSTTPWKKLTCFIYEYMGKIITRNNNSLWTNTTFHTCQIISIHFLPYGLTYLLNKHFHHVHIFLIFQNQSFLDLVIF